jgi:hypothetical protein
MANIDNSRLPSEITVSWDGRWSSELCTKVVVADKPSHKITAVVTPDINQELSK